MNLSPHLAIAFVLAFICMHLITQKFLWSALNRLLLPFYQKGDCTKVGFVYLGKAREPNKLRGTAYHRFIFPLMIVINLFFSLLLGSRIFPAIAINQNDFYFLLGVWVTAMLAINRKEARTIFIAMLVPFVIIYFISGSLYYGCIGSALILSFFFASSYQQVYLFRLSSSRIEHRTGSYIDGRKIEFQKSYPRYFLRTIIPLLMLFTVIRIITNLDVSTSGITLKYLDEPAQNFVSIIVLLLIYLNISIRLFTGGIFSYLQVDLLALVGQTMRRKQEDPDRFDADDNIAEQKGRVDETKKVVTLNATDRIPQLQDTSTPLFNSALTMYSIDLFLTAAAVLGFPFVPGITPENTVTLSTIVKVPLYILVIIQSIPEINLWLNSKSIANYDSQTRREVLGEQSIFYKDLEKLLYDIQEQQFNPVNYINVSGNKYLLWLAGVSFNQKRIHV